jgi:hypothetical protein
MSKIGRNVPCHCGSGKKYKKCCLPKDEEIRQIEQQNLQYEQDVQSGRIDPFASEHDWEEHDEELQFDQEDASEEGYGFDTENDVSLDLTPESRDPLPIASKKLSDEDDAIIEVWWNAYTDISDPDELRSHIENFMDSYPHLMVNLGIDEEPLFQLEGMYVRQNRHEEYIEVLSRLRSEFPDAYFKRFSYFDETMISWLVMTDRKNKVAEYLLDFRKYPSSDPDNLFNVIHFLTSWNCQDILADFIPDICNEVCTSPKIIGGSEILNPMINIIMAPFLDLGHDACDPVKLAEEIKAIGDVVNPVWRDPGFLKNRLEFILGNYEQWSLDGCRTRRQAIERYDEMTGNFMGWLCINKNLDWCASGFHSHLVFAYLAEAMPEKKKPREPFPFAEANMMRILVSLSQNMMGLDPIRLFGTLNGLYWFMEFLEETLSLSSEQATMNRESCVRLFEQAYPAQREQDFKALAWERFPREKQ